MSIDRIFNIGTLIVASSIVFILVSHKETAEVIRQLGSAFSGSIRTAQGR